MIWLAIVLIIVLLGIGAVLAAFLLFWSRNEVPFVRTPKAVIEQIIYALDLTDKGTIIELGSGDGVLLKAIRKSTSAPIIGVENNPIVFWVSKLRLGRTVGLVYGDILKTGLTGATRVYCYLSDRQMAALELRFESQLASGSRVVSLQFPLPHRKPNRVVRLKDGRAHAANLYIYDY